jgi:hypothetical protein
MLCDPSVAGFPDRRTDVPVHVRLVSEQTLCVDGEPRRIVWSEGETVSLKFWLMAANASAIASAARPWRGLRGS